MSYLEKLKTLNFLLEPYEMRVEMKCVLKNGLAKVRFRLKNASSEVYTLDINRNKCFESWTHIDTLVENLGFVFVFRTGNHEHYRADNIYFKCHNIEEMCMKRDLLVNKTKLWLNAEECFAKMNNE